MCVKSTTLRAFALCAVLSTPMLAGLLPADDGETRPLGELSPLASNCPSELTEGEPCSIDLITGKVSESCHMEPFFRIHSGPTDSNDDGWLEATVGVDLTEECSRVCVVLDYSEEPQGWTFNLGDSSTNNGYGGGAGGPESEAEVHIVNQHLIQWSIGLGPSILDRVAEAKLQLGNGSYKVCASDQKVTFGQPQSSASTPNSKLLYALPDNGTNPANSQLFVGLNRVIHSLNSASPSPADRVGSGLRRAYITID